MVLELMGVDASSLAWLFFMVGTVYGFTDSNLVVLAQTLNSFVQRDIEPTIFDQVLKRNPVLYRFWRKGPKKAGGSVLSWPILTATKVNGAWYAGSGTLPHGAEDTAKSAYVEWRHVAEDVTIPRTDLLRASGTNAKVDAIKFKFDEAIMNLRTRISQASFTRPTLTSGGTEPLALDNLFEAVDDGNVTTTYATIAHSNSYWQPGISGAGVKNKGGASIAALQEIEDLLNECSDGDEQPTLGVIGPKGRSFIWGQMQALQRYTSDDEMTKAGFDNIKIDKCVFVIDRNTVAQSCLLLNEAWVDLVSHEDENFVIDPIIPGTQDQRVLNTKVAWSGNWRVKSVRYHGKFINAGNF